MRYFFHAAKVYLDEQGQEFGSDKDARAHAAKIANELAESDVFDGAWILILDVEGVGVGAVQVSRPRSAP